MTKVSCQFCGRTYDIESPGLYKTDERCVNCREGPGGQLNA